MVWLPLLYDVIITAHHNWLKSYGILKLPIVSKISNRMAGNSKLRTLYFLNRLCFFDNFFHTWICLYAFFQNHWLLLPQREKNNFGITLVTSFSYQKPFGTDCLEFKCLSSCKFELPRLRHSKIIPRMPLQASCCPGVHRIDKLSQLYVLLIFKC